MYNPLDTNQYLIPLLTTGTQDNPLYYNPEKFLEEYGVYLPDYDETDELFAKEEKDIVQKNIVTQGSQEINKAESAYGKMGNIDAYYSAGDTLYSSVSDQLNIAEITSLEKQKRAQSNYLADWFAGVATIGSYGGFQHESPGTEAISTEEMEELYPNYFGSPESTVSNASPGSTGWTDTTSNPFSNYNFGLGDFFGGAVWDIMQASNSPMGSEEALPYTQTYGTMSEEIQSAYEECVDGSSAAEQEFCFNWAQEQMNDVNNIVSNMMICDPESPYYDEAACLNASTGG